MITMRPNLILLQYLQYFTWAQSAILHTRIHTCTIHTVKIISFSYQSINKCGLL